MLILGGTEEVEEGTWEQLLPIPHHVAFAHPQPADNEESTPFIEGFTVFLDEINQYFRDRNIWPYPDLCYTLETYLIHAGHMTSADRASRQHPGGLLEAAYSTLISGYFDILRSIAV